VGGAGAAGSAISNRISVSPWIHGIGISIVSVSISIVTIIIVSTIISSISLNVVVSTIRFHIAGSFRLSRRLAHGDASSECGNECGHCRVPRVRVGVAPPPANAAGPRAAVIVGVGTINGIRRFAVVVVLFCVVICQLAGIRVVIATDQDQSDGGSAARAFRDHAGARHAAVTW
jgi:hypothetical protein